jgi:uncharacterized membrane protein
MFWQENAHNLTEKGIYESVEQIILGAARWLELGIETAGAVIIGIGIILAIYRLALHFKEEQSADFNHIRLTLGKFLVLALEFQVAADILSTAIAPNWEQIGKLAAVAAIRTVLNYFLTKELENERRREENSKAEI